MGAVSERAAKLLWLLCQLWQLCHGYGCYSSYGSYSSIAAMAAIVLCSYAGMAVVAILWLSSVLIVFNLTIIAAHSIGKVKEYSRQPKQ